MPLQRLPMVIGYKASCFIIFLSSGSFNSPKSTRLHQKSVYSPSPLPDFLHCTAFGHAHWSIVNQGSRWTAFLQAPNQNQDDCLNASLKRTTKSCGASNLLNHLPERNKIPCSFGHRHRLALPQYSHKLHKQNMKCVFWMAKCPYYSLNARYIAVMIAPQMFMRLLNPLELIPMVCYICSKICIAAILLYYHPVLVIPKGRGTKPEGIILSYAKPRSLSSSIDFWTELSFKRLCSLNQLSNRTLKSSKSC